MYITDLGQTSVATVGQMFVPGTHSQGSQDTPAPYMITAAVDPLSGRFKIMSHHRHLQFLFNAEVITTMVQRW